MSALIIQISPQNIELSGKIEQETCLSLNIKVDDNEILLAESKWGDGSKNLINYNKLPEDLSIKEEYSHLIFPGNNSFCFIFSKPGNYFGAILIKPRNSMFGIGAWISLNIEGKNLITGGVIGNNMLGKIVIAEVFSFILLIILFFIISKKYKARKHSE